MKNNLHPCIWYNGNAKEAAEFYCSVFPNSAITTNTPMVVNFDLYGQKFMGLNGGPMFTPNASISFFIICETDEEINELWNKLSEQGLIMMPLNKYEWSERYGFLTDKFGLSWQLMKGSYNDVNQKITPCFLFVGDSYGKAEKAVHFYTNIFSTSEINGILLYQPEEGENVAGKVKHAQFVIDEKIFMAMDGFGEHTFEFNEGISFVVECKNQEEIDYYWNKLIADGGKESRCGWLKDPFGISWQIIPADISKILSDKEHGNKAMQALMTMNKIIIADLVNA